MPPKSIVVDFDNTIASTSFPTITKLNDGVVEALSELRSLGYRIIISSCRSSMWHVPEYFEFKSEFQAMVDFLNENNVPYDELDHGDKGKPLGNYYIDDKAIGYTNNWKEIVDLIRKKEMLMQEQTSFDFMTAKEVPPSSGYLQTYASDNGFVSGGTYDPLYWKNLAGVVTTSTFYNYEAEELKLKVSKLEKQIDDLLDIIKYITKE